LYVVNIDGSDPRRLTYTQSGELAPNWSSDGRQIAFVSERDRNWELYLINVDGTNSRRLTSTATGEWDPDW
jgi:TolB protein